MIHRIIFANVGVQNFLVRWPPCGSFDLLNEREIFFMLKVQSKKLLIIFFIVHGGFIMSPTLILFSLSTKVSAKLIECAFLESCAHVL